MNEKRKRHLHHAAKKQRDMIKSIVSRERCLEQWRSFEGLRDLNENVDKYPYILNAMTDYRAAARATDSRDVETRSRPFSGTVSRIITATNVPRPLRTRALAVAENVRE